jgi:DNA-binding IclR family transcriptional regulator
MYMPRTPGTPTSVAGRVVAILNAFTDEPDALHLVTISDRSGLPLSTTYRLVTELLDGRLLSRSEDRTYRLGPRIFELGRTIPEGTAVPC